MKNAFSVSAPLEAVKAQFRKEGISLDRIVFVETIGAYCSLVGTFNKKTTVIVIDSPGFLDSIWKFVPLSKINIKEQIQEPNTPTRIEKRKCLRVLQSTASSFLSNFLTLSYKFKDPNEQAVVRKQVFDGLLTNTIPTDIDKDVAKLIASADYAPLALAIKEVKEGMSAVDAAAKHKVSAFDINYVLSKTA